MSKDYRYQSEELDSVEEEDFHTKKVGTKRHQSVKKQTKS